MESKAKALIKALLFSLIPTVVITGGGMLINFISYQKTGELYFYTTITGGEYIGQEGFGLLQNHVYPLAIEGVPNSGDHIWLEFSADSLIHTLVPVFVCSFIVLAIVFLLVAIIKDKPAKRKEG